MTIQQLEYILAVDQFRHFARAAEYCRVTQPTLSAMIQKLEDELGVKLFDRTVQPVCPTAIGEKIIDQARVILAQTAQVKEIISEEKQSLAGVFHLGVLPTIAPYLLPRFFPQLMENVISHSSVMQRTSAYTWLWVFHFLEFPIATSLVVFFCYIRIVKRY